MESPTPPAILLRIARIGDNQTSTTSVSILSPGAMWDSLPFLGSIQVVCRGL